MIHKDSDLIILHGMAIRNTPMDALEQEFALTEYRKHKEHCIEEYGLETTFRAENHGWYRDHQ